jgi:hypothetical protein
VLEVVSVDSVPLASVLPLCVSVVVLKSAEKLPECWEVVSVLQPLELSAHDLGAANAAAAPPRVIIIASSAAVTNIVMRLIIYRTLLPILPAYRSTSHR